MTPHLPPPTVFCTACSPSSSFQVYPMWYLHIEIPLNYAPCLLCTDMHVSPISACNNDYGLPPTRHDIDLFMVYSIFSLG